MFVIRSCSRTHGDNSREWNWFKTQVVVFSQGDSSVAVLLCCVPVVIHVVFLSSLFVSPSIGASGRLCFVIVAFPWYVHLYFTPSTCLHSVGNYEDVNSTVQFCICSAVRKPSFCVPNRDKSARASALSDQSLYCPHGHLASLAIHKSPSKDFDRTAWIRRLIWIWMYVFWRYGTFNVMVIIVYSYFHGSNIFRRIS